MERVLINITDKLCAKPQSKTYDLIDKFTCQYTTQAVYLMRAMYYKIIAQHDNFKVITIPRLEWLQVTLAAVMRQVCP